MILDSWLALKGISPADLGRRLGLKWAHQVRRYMQFLANGKPNRRYHPPSRLYMFKIRKMTEGKVSLDDWPDPYTGEYSAPPRLKRKRNEHDCRTRAGEEPLREL